MKWMKLVVFIVVECLKAIQRGWAEGRADVREKIQREEFERANSGEEVVLDKRSEKR